MYFPTQTHGSKLSPLFNPNESFEDDFPLLEKSISDLCDLMSSGKMTSLEIVSLYLERINKLDPKLHSILQINPKAIDDAKQCDELRNKGIMLPLLGIPILIKDNIEVANLVNSAGSCSIEDLIPNKDAPCVEQLKKAGAVILGKTNMSEWAFYRSSLGISGWSGRGGRVCNPYALDRSTYGSSSGSASSVSSNLAVAALGTETDGSIVGPAALCGIVGFKPTYNKISGEGVIPLAPSFDTVGPMAKCVKDVATLYSVLENSPTSFDYASALDEQSLKGKRIGVIRNRLTTRPFIENVLNDSLCAMQDVGAQLEDVELKNIEEWVNAEITVFSYEFKIAIDKYLADKNCKIKTLDKIIEFNREHASSELKYFDQDLLENALNCKLSKTEYSKLLTKAKELAGPKGIDALLEKYNLDCLIAVETLPAWQVDYVNGDILHDVSGSIAAVSGYPSISVPMGDVAGLPLGLLFIGTKDSEKDLLSLAYSFEQSTKKRIVPKFYKTLEL